MTDSASSSEADDDLSEFHGVFFDEVEEHLTSMESLLLQLDPAAPGREALDAIFRAAHSIKGGAGVFGFDDMAALTHEMETVFDRVRKGTLPLVPALIDAFLRAGDLLGTMLGERREHRDSSTRADAEALCATFRSMLAGDAPAPKVEAASPVPTPTPAMSPSRASGGTRIIEINFAPFDDTFDAGVHATVFAGLVSFGPVVTMAGEDSPHRVRIETLDTLANVADALGFVLDPSKFTVTEVVAAATGSAPADAARAVVDGDPAGPEAPGPIPAAEPGQPTMLRPAPAVESAAPVSAKAAPARTAAANDDAGSIRVSIQKVDQLINLVGELVITQSMLANSASPADSTLFEALHNGLSQLQRNTRDLQEAAMSIRMMPMSFAFSRFPRMVRDIAAKLGKDIELVTLGETTELDKGLIERIVDPLTHLVRNSLDHGIETPAERIAAGKPAAGTLTMRAYHQGGAIVIEVGDDGRGLGRERILAKARERGMPVSDAMSDGDVWQLIFEAGFSTAAVVTDVSGRGVGMDVVKRNIQALGGRIDIHSEAGRGTRMTIRLPLTLAILDGLSVGVADEQYIIPLTYIVESLQPASVDLKTVAGHGRVVHVRGEYLPVVALHEVFGIRSSADEPHRDAHHGILVILETEGRKTALLVDTLIGQHQVVIKSLESNYRRVRGIAGATIMGTGKVALILDAVALADMAHPLLAA